MKHRYKSINGAVRMIRVQEKIIQKYEESCSRFKAERNLMAQLASDKPEFSNPLVVWDARKLRDQILQREGS